MARKHCNSCDGEYDDVGPDGLLYFHACPSVTRVRVQRDGQRHVVALADVQPTDTIVVERAGQRQEITAAELQPDDRRLDDVTQDRADRRDENAAVIGGEDEPDPRGREGRRRIKARGRGASVITR